MQEGVIIQESIVFFQTFLEEVLCHGMIRFEKALCHGTIHLEEAFVYGVLVDVWRVVREHRHHPVGERAIECVVAGEDCHAFSLQFFLYLIERIAHLIAQSLGFFRARDDAPVVVAQNNHGLSYQVGTKHSFARTVEVIAIS